MTSTSSSHGTPPINASPDGRRVLVAVVTGPVGDAIQAWRKRHDPEQARRLPPHATLCYWPPNVELAVLERQVRHAFDRPVSVRLGQVHELDNADRTFYVSVHDTEALDEARQRLYDGTHVALPGTTTWAWHVTCVRYGVRRDLLELRRLVMDITFPATWQVDTVAYLRLEAGVYQPIATWRVG